MNDMKENVRSNLSGTATVILLSFLLFYLPSMLALFSHGNEPWEWTVLSMVMATFYTAVFCINYFLLVPRTIFRNDRKILFYLTNLILITFICALIPLWFERHGGMPRPRHPDDHELSIMQYLMGYLRFVIRDGVMMVLAATLAYALRLTQERENMRRTELELDAEKRKIELKSLKAQLNPHFLFNSLNNIYALIAISPERAQKALHDLSGMLRFMIYDAASAYVPLSKEMQFIADYVELMKLRLGSSIKLSCHIQQKGSEGMVIAPLLFLTLVENAFKHVANNGISGFIDISIFIEDEKVVCRVENSCTEGEIRKSLAPAESGIGLRNVRRQLRLLYPDSHSLTLKKEEGVHFAEIIIDKSRLTVAFPQSDKDM